MNQDLTTGKPSRVLWKFCLPLFGSIIFQQLYNIADSFVAGKFIGENALAAVGNSYEITLIFIAFAFGCNIGCSVVAAQFFGAKDLRSMKTTIYTTLIASAGLCAVLMLVGLLLSRLSPAACEGAYARSAQRLLQWPDLRRGAYDSGPWLLRRAAEEGLPMPVHPGGEPIADQLARQLSLPEVRLQPELLAEAERRLERERSVRRETLLALLETAERTEGDFAVCGYDPMQLRAQDGLLWSGSFLALRQADGTVRRLFGPCAVQLADDPHRATALFVPRM